MNWLTFPLTDLNNRWKISIYTENKITMVADYFIVKLFKFVHQVLEDCHGSFQKKKGGLGNVYLVLKDHSPSGEFILPILTWFKTKIPRDCTLQVLFCKEKLRWLHIPAADFAKIFTFEITKDTDLISSPFSHLYLWNLAVDMEKHT